MREIGWGGGAIALISMVAPQTMAAARAEDVPELERIVTVEHAPPPRDAWRLQAEPYVVTPVWLWGRATIRDQSVPIEDDLGAALSSLHLAAGVRAEAWYQMLGLILDASYLGAGSERATGEVPSDLDWRAFVADALLGVRPLRFPVGDLRGRPAIALELDGGLRTTHGRSVIDAGPVHDESTDTLLQGLLGLNVPVQLTPNVVVRIAGTAQAPDWSGSVTAHVELVFLPVVVDLGYRYFRTRYRSSRVDLDLDGHGPFVGVGLRWGESSFYP